ncbi:MAG: circadian clock KaiB family protein [Verrucomicrobiota bacterium]
MDEECQIRMFISKDTTNSDWLISRLSMFCEYHLRIPYKIVVVVVEQEPDLAEVFRVMAIPTLQITYQEFDTRFIGDYTENEQFGWALEAMIRGISVRAKSNSIIKKSRSYMKNLNGTNRILKD